MLHLPCGPMAINPQMREALAIRHLAGYATLGAAIINEEPHMNRSVILIGALLCSACGGGGGGTGNTKGFYAGMWTVSATKVVDDCQAGLDETISRTVTVNQNGNTVVLDSGSLVLTGTTNEDDGFTVTHSDFTDGCTRAAAYSFGNASDGLADVGFALSVQCGVAKCTAAYSGSGERLNGKIEFSKDTESEFEQLQAATGQSVPDLNSRRLPSGLSLEMLAESVMHSENIGQPE